MYGNRLGWTIAVVLAGLIALGAWQVSRVNGRTPPTSLLADTSALEPLAMEVPPASVYRSEQPGDGGELCRRAIAFVRRDTDRYADLLNTTDAATIEPDEAVGLLKTAAPLAGDVVLSADAAANVGYGVTSDDLDAVLLLGRLLGHVAALSADPAAGGRWYEAQFSLGRRLFDERVRYAEAMAGLTLMRDAAAGLRTLAERRGDTTRAARLDGFDRSLVSLQRRRMQPVWDALGTTDNAAVAAHAGDVDALAGPLTKERLWRVEAILALGRHRFNVGRLSDQLAAPTRLRALATTETDPVILAAVAAAERLTIEEFRLVQ